MAGKTIWTDPNIADQYWQDMEIKTARLALARGKGVPMDQAMRELYALIEHAEQRRALQTIGSKQWA
jgi:hypothetical protein